MSQTNRESTEDLDNESNDVSSESSTNTSSAGGGGGASSNVSGSSNSGSCCSASGSNSEASSSATSASGAAHHVIDDTSNDDSHHSTTTQTGLKCDIRTIATNCPSTNQYSNEPGPSGNKQGTRQTNEESSPAPRGILSQPTLNATSTLQSTISSHLNNDTQNYEASSSTADILDPHKQTRRVNLQQSQPKLNTTNTSSTSSPNSNLTVPSLTTTTTTNQQKDDSSLDDARRTRRTLRPAPSPSPSMSAIDPNNNKNKNTNGPSSQSMRAESLSGFRKSNFSKSASGSRLVNQRTPSSARPNVCDCLAQNCGEKQHSNRRQFIEQYYNSRTRLPSSTNAMSSFNINTPLNRLSECDAITKRLLSSPIRTTNIIESPTRRAQISEVDRARRASLGTNTMTDQVFLFSSNQFNSLELNYRKNSPGEGDEDGNDDDNEDGDDDDDDEGDGDDDDDAGEDNREEICDEFLENTRLIGENDVKLKQQQGRSLSVCDEDTLKPRLRKGNPNHSSNLNRAVSLAYESGSSKRLLTIIPLFGCDIKTLEQFMRLGLIIPPAIDSAVEHLLLYGSDAVGIFRKSGVKSRILTLKQRIESNQDAKIDELNKNNEFSIYDIADLVKLWFRELKPTPLMTKESIKIISDHLQTTYTTNTTMTQAEKDLRRRVSSILTPGHRALFSRALTFFASIASKFETNQMTSQNLAICLTPSLCATETDQESIITAQKALEYCIDNYRILF